MATRKTATTEPSEELGSAPTSFARQLLVFGQKTFRITVPAGCRITFGPWSPPTAEKGYGGNSDKALDGTLRVYQGSSRTTENVIAVFSGVTGFRDLSLGYAEQVAKEEGATIWKDDKDGYVRESKVKRSREWVTPEIPLLGESQEDKD